MTVYHPPMDDIRFVLNEVLNAGALSREIPEFKDADWGTISDMLDAVADYARDVAHPLNQSGDKEGCTYDPITKSVKTPAGFKEAYDLYAQMGLIGMSSDPQYGGMGMPFYLSVVASEMLTAANFSLSSYPGLTGGAYKALHTYASDELKDLYLPKMLSGEWSGTMCLTEPQAGSDLGLIKTRAIPEADGSYAITGNKIFITCGEHDLTENILHLVLARLPGAPEGTKGISLFLVPKFLPDANGNPGARNPAVCTGIEHKMGINASATCSMSFDGAKGWLVGEPHKGMKAMFMMMNDARLKVGMQGLGLSEIAWQNAAVYAQDRVQGASLKDAMNASAKAVPIINHANVRRHLMDIKSQIDGFRGLAYDMALTLDRAAKHPDSKVRAEAEQRASLMMPVIKACLTDLSTATAQKGIQLHGGAGFINETGVNQFYRDAIIGTIYEGTNDIQSIDFMFRKVIATGGKPLMAYDDEVRQQVARAAANSQLHTGMHVMIEGLNTLQSVFGTVMPKILGRKPDRDTPKGASGAEKATSKSLLQSAILKASEMKILKPVFGTVLPLVMHKKLDDVNAHADEALAMFGRIAVGSSWLKMMTVASEKLKSIPANDPSGDFYRQKLALGDHYFRHIMRPDMKRLEFAIEAGAAFLNIPVGELQPKPDTGIAKEESVKNTKGYETPSVP